MLYAFTASREVESSDRVTIAARLSTLDPPPSVVVTGGARGGDEYIAKLSSVMYPEAQQWVLFPSQANVSVARSLQEFFESEKTVHRFESVPGTHRDRNVRIVEMAKAGHLVGFPKYRESHPKSERSGTWQTIRLAKVRGALVSYTVLRSE